MLRSSREVGSTRSPRRSGMWAERAGATGAAVVITALALTLGACGGSPTQEPAQNTASRVYETPPAKGDVDLIKWNLPTGEPSTMYPPHSFDFSAGTVMSNLCDTLVTTEPDLTDGKGLAERIDQPDPTTYVFTLHDGVRFWNGDPLTAEDVEYSLAMHLDPAVATYYGAMYKNVESVTATGPLEVTVKLRKPDVAFYNYLDSAGGAIGQAKFIKAAGARYGTPSGGLMCSGPFEFVKWTPGQQIEVRRNDDYWNPKHRAHAAAMTFQFITSSNTMTQAMQSGAIDGSFQISSASVPGLRNAATGTLYSSTATRTIAALLPAASDGPIADVRIRRALSMAIDRAGLVQGVLPGLATPLDWMMPPTVMDPPVQTEESSKIYKDALATLPKGSLDEAKKLVAEAGAPNRPLVLAIPEGDEEIRRVGTVLQATATQIGLTLDLRVTPPADLNSMYYDAQQREGIDLLWNNDTMAGGSPLSMFGSYLGPEAGNNLLNYQNPEVDDAIARASATTDQVEQAEILAPVLVKVAEDAAMITLYTPNANTFLSKRLTGVGLADPFFASGIWAPAVGAAE
jgi:peptide/nickel transport system substrate-binding protein